MDKNKLIKKLIEIEEQYFPTSSHQKNSSNIVELLEYFEHKQKENIAKYPSIKDEIFALFRSSDVDFQKEGCEIAEAFHERVVGLIICEYITLIYPNFPKPQFWYNYCTSFLELYYLKMKEEISRIFLHGLHIIDVYADSNFYKTNTTWLLYAVIDQKSVDLGEESALISISLLKKGVEYYDYEEEVANYKWLLAKLYEKIGDIEAALQAYIGAFHDGNMSFFDEEERQCIIRFVENNNLQERCSQYLSAPNLVKIFDKEPTVFDGGQFLKEAESIVNKKFGKAKSILNPISYDHLVAAYKSKLKREYKGSCVEFCHLFENELRQRLFNPYKQSLNKNPRVLSELTNKANTLFLDPFFTFIKNKNRQMNLRQIYYVLKEGYNIKNIPKNSIIGYFLSFCIAKNAYILQKDFIDDLDFLSRARNSMSHSGFPEMLMDDYMGFENRAENAIKKLINVL
jgi:hypothetical protein